MEFAIHNDTINHNTYVEQQQCVCVCVTWSNSLCTKDLWHNNIEENMVKEVVQDKKVAVMYIEGKKDLADMYTKEMKDMSHFIL